MKLLLFLLLLASAGCQEDEFSGQILPSAEINQPEPDECMLKESGSFMVAVTIHDWLSGMMRIRVNNTLVSDTHDGHMQEIGEPGLQMSWEIYGLQPNQYYTASVEFFDANTGQVLSGASRTSFVLPFKDPFEDPPQVEIVYPVSRGQPEYPTIQGESSQIAAQTVDNALVRVGQAMVILVNAGSGGFFGRMNQVGTRMNFPEEAYRRMCPLLVPQMVLAALFTTEGTEVITLSRPVMFWAGDFTEEERAELSNLEPVVDNGEHTVIYPAPTYWTQAKRPDPLSVLDDGSYGPPDTGLPIMGFMAKENPEGFNPGEDFEAVGYEPPPPGFFGHLWARAPEGQRVTFVITSCGRLPGLRRTITSFLAANTYPIDRYVIIEDSGDMDMAAKIIDEFGDIFDVLINKKRMGQLFSIDKAYSVVRTEYIFHCEDDWVFNGIPHFVRNSVSILQEEPKAFTVHISNTSFLYPVDDFESETADGVKYHRILNPVPNAKGETFSKRFYAVSFHPGLRRTSDYLEHLRPMQVFFQEDHINTYLFWKGFFMVKLPERYCNHLDINSISRHMEYHIKHMAPDKDSSTKAEL